MKEIGGGVERVAGKLQEGAWKTENLRARKEEKGRGQERKRQRRATREEPICHFACLGPTFTSVKWV